MKASTTIQEMLAGNQIFVPSYQRAYSWDSPGERETKTQTDVFINDLEEYIRSTASSPYYFGHFLFEEKGEKLYAVIDGQQRLTTISIFLCALFSRLRELREGRELNENELTLFEDMVQRRSRYTFKTVEYDNLLFRSYVVDQTKRDKMGIDTESQNRIVKAFDYFKSILSVKDEAYLSSILKVVSQASCTTHRVTNESEAIQMFLFQNNRGKKPSNLELLKAQFMFNIHLYGGDDAEFLIQDVKERFEKIYKSISSIEYNIDEDDVLIQTLRVHFNSLWETNSNDRINKILSNEDSIIFIKEFTYSLSQSFEYLSRFFGKDERNYIEIHSIITLGGLSIALPFIIKAYSFGIDSPEIAKLCETLESIVLRHRLIGTRADLTSRLNDIYQKFTFESPSIEPIISRINWMKTVPHESWWWAYWNDVELAKALRGGLNHGIAKFLLWKYENHLLGLGKSGYSVTRFDSIQKPELEHIAPQTPKDGKPIESGYCEYDEEFVQQYLNSIGNFLLLSKSHNCSVGNSAFEAKRDSYTHLSQQREIQDITKDGAVWGKEQINERAERIINVVMSI